LLILLLSGSISLYAQRGNGRGGMFGQTGRVTPVLTEKQKTDMTALTEKYRVEMDTLRAQLRRSTDIKKRGDLAGKIQILSDTYKSDATKLLTDEQKKSLETPKTNLSRNIIVRDSLFRGRTRIDSLRRAPMPIMPYGRGQLGNQYFGRGFMPMPMMPYGRGFGGNNYFGRGGFNYPGSGMGRRR
jgi:hypothetical protein